MPATEPEHDRVELPEPPVMLVDDKVHDRLVEFVVTPSATVPENPFTDATDIVDVAAMFTVVETLVGLAAMLKSCT